MLGCLIAVGAIAKLLGAGRGAWLARRSCLVFRSAFWKAPAPKTTMWQPLVAFAYFVVLSRQRHLPGREWLSMSAALGLGMLTKATIYIYAFPLAVWLLVPGLIRGQRLKAILSGAGIGLSIIALNIGYWLRNTATFGGAFGSTDWTQSKIAAAWPGQILVGPMRQVLLNAATPSEGFTRLSWSLSDRSKRCSAFRSPRLVLLGRGTMRTTLAARCT